MRREKVTALIPTFNNADLISDVIDDLKWADQILIVDSFSTDGTPELCRTKSATVLQHVYENSARQKNWSIPHCAQEWVLLVDTDERLPAELQTEIQQLLQEGVPADIDAFRIARRTMFLGKWLRVMNLWPDSQTRLFRRSVGRYQDKEVHADVIVPGRIVDLKSPLVHNATLTLSKQINLLDRYSTYQAVELEKRARRFRWFDVVIRPIGAFIYLYLIRLGFTAGMRGLFVAFHTMAFSFFTYAKLWEKEWRDGKWK